MLHDSLATVVTSGRLLGNGSVSESCRTAAGWLSNEIERPPPPLLPLAAPEEETAAPSPASLCWLLAMDERCSFGIRKGRVSSSVLFSPCSDDGRPRNSVFTLANNRFSSGLLRCLIQKWQIDLCVFVCVLAGQQEHKTTWQQTQLTVTVVEREDERFAGRRLRL